MRPVSDLSHGVCTEHISMIPVQKRICGVNRDKHHPQQVVFSVQ